MILHLSVVVFARLCTWVPALLLGVRNGFQVARDGRTTEVESVDTIFWKHQDLGTLTRGR